MATKVEIEVDEDVLRNLVLTYLHDQLGMEFNLTKDDIKIEVKSAQNYKSEWETARFRARVCKSTSDLET